MLFSMCIEPSLRALLNELHPVRASWYNIGLELDIPYTTLDCFKQNYSDQLDLMREMLKHWLKAAVDPCPTWEAVVRALRSPIVNEMNVAEQLKSKYCVSLQCMQKKPNRTSLPPSESSQKPPFGCGCCKCTFFSFIETGCPTPLPSVSSFPHLDLSGLTDEQQQELRGRLRSESQEIMIRFQKLVSATIKSLISLKVSPSNLVSRLLTLGAFKPVFKEPQVPLLQFCFERLEAVDTIPEVFLVLKDYFSFFNYHIVEHIIDELGAEEDKTRLQRYKEYFNWYAKRRIFECLPEFGPVNDASHADIFVKVDSQYDNYTVAEIEVFCHKLGGILHVSSRGILHLCRVEEGCLQLTFQVPLFVQKEVFPLSREQERTLKAEGVIKLTCGKYQFSHDEDSVEKLQPDINSGKFKHLAIQTSVKLQPDINTGHILLYNTSVEGNY